MTESVKLVVRLESARMYSPLLLDKKPRLQMAQGISRLQVYACIQPYQDTMRGRVL